ncbi:MAG: radical SAM protein [Candidatus Nealsonbacteria bacterium]
MKRQIVLENKAASCYFRTSVEPPYRKALVQITERCNLYCAHCFVSAGNYGDAMSLKSIREVLVPQLKACRVVSITLTGGEPFVHPNLLEITSLFRGAGMKVGICTNATCIEESQIEALTVLGGVHYNVSLDGFSPESHGKFRGDKESFAKTVATVRALGRRKSLQGLLVTPNNLAEVDEYSKLCEFAVENGAAYVLINPLSSMGRGVRAMNKLAASNETMRQIAVATSSFAEKVQLVHIRFPNDKKLPLASCEAGNIIYIFTRGELTVCPYLVFAARTPQSLHRAEEFIVGNIFRDEDIAERIDAYKLNQRYRLGGNPTCEGCSLNAQCGKGCPAAIIAGGKRIEEVDAEVCSMVNP